MLISPIDLILKKWSNRRCPVDISKIREFFFRAMASCLASGLSEEIQVHDMPDFLAIHYRDGDFRLQDQYCAIPGEERSAGTTTIWFKDRPIWIMNYGGAYSKEAIPFLRAVLRKTYETGQFIGGRGPAYYKGDSFIYFNQGRLFDFTNFNGREEIYRYEDGEPLGFHDYWGMSLLSTSYR